MVIATVWSGNWHIGLEPAGPDATSVTAGISPWKFSHTLLPGAVFEAPSVLIAVGPDLNEASVQLTRAVAATLPRSPASEAIPVEWNPWWPYKDQDINEAVFLANVDVGSRLGIEVSTLDAGWFGESDATTAWWDIRGDFTAENRTRFPHGIAWLAEETRRRGQKFGIWMELEAVGLKAKLRGERSDLMARRDNDPPEKPLDPADPGFLGYICLGSRAGRAYAKNALETLVKKTRCEWIKLDFDRSEGRLQSAPTIDHGEGDGLYAHYRASTRCSMNFAQPIRRSSSKRARRADCGSMPDFSGMCTVRSCPIRIGRGISFRSACTSRLLPPAAMLHWAMSEFAGSTRNKPWTCAIPRSRRSPSMRSYARPSCIGLEYHGGCRIYRNSGASASRDRSELYKRVVRPFVRNGDLRRLTGTPRRDGSGEQRPAFQLSLGDRHSSSVSHLNLRRTARASGRQRCLLKSDTASAILIFPTPKETQPRTGAAWMSEGFPPVRRPSFIGLLEPVLAE